MRFFKVPYSLVKRKDLSQAELMFMLNLMCLESKFNKEGEWFDVGYSEMMIKNHTSINKYRKSLKEKGLLDFRNGYSTDGKKQNSQYILFIDRYKPEDNEKKPDGNERNEELEKRCMEQRNKIIRRK